MSSSAKAKARARDSDRAERRAERRADYSANIGGPGWFSTHHMQEMLDGGIEGHQQLCARPAGQVLAEAHRALQNKTEEEFYGPCPDTAYPRFCAVPGWVSKGRRVKPIASPALAIRICKRVGKDLFKLNYEIDDCFAKTRGTFMEATASWGNWDYACRMPQERRNELVKDYAEMQKKRELTDYWDAWKEAEARGETYVRGTVPKGWTGGLPVLLVQDAAKEAQEAADAAKMSSWLVRALPLAREAEARTEAEAERPAERLAERSAGSKRARSARDEDIALVVDLTGDDE